MRWYQGLIKRYFPFEKLDEIKMGVLKAKQCQTTFLDQTYRCSPSSSMSIALTGLDAANLL